MGRSQRHLFERDGKDSAGEGVTAYSPHGRIIANSGNVLTLTAKLHLSGQWDGLDKVTVRAKAFGTQPLATLTDATGTEASPSKITLAGAWDGQSTIRIHITSATVNADFEYTPAGVETPVQAATGFAAVIDANAKLAAVGNGPVVEILSEDGETAHTLSALVVERNAFTDQDYSYEIGPGNTPTPREVLTEIAAMLDADTYMACSIPPPPSDASFLQLSAVVPATEVQLSNLRITRVPDAKIEQANGTQVANAVLRIKGMWDGTTKLTVHIVATGGTTDADFTYIPNGGKSLADVATEFAALINADVDLVATADYDKVLIHAAPTATGVVLSAVVTEGGPMASITNAAGTDAVPSTIAISASWNTHTKIKVHVVSVTLDDDYEYTPVGIETPEQVATGFALVLAAAVGLAAVANGAVVEILSDGGEVAHTLSALAITAV